MGAAKKAFKPEFLNRITELVVFHMLEKKDLMTIVELETQKVVARLEEKGIHISLDDSAKELLIEEGYDPAYGARPMRRAVERHLEDPLAEHLLRGDIQQGDTVKVTYLEDEKRLKFTAEESDPEEKEPVTEEA
jgi:ATP-dependent Clp protease ATP-binding subunit ClpC